MHLLPPLLIFLSALSPTLSHPSPAELTPRTSTPSLPFSQTYLFTATLSLSAPTTPITATGGVVITSSILNGTITGPALNGTVTSGIAAPFVTSAQTSTGAKTTLQLPNIYIAGTTDDGFPFFVSEVGVGGSEKQVARLVSDGISVRHLLSVLFVCPLSVRKCAGLMRLHRQTIDIGGGPKYANLRDGFVLATTNHNADVTAVEVQGWLVENAASFV